jgi:3-dehydroquinate dehydratase/shikimate dehydrogenase
LREAIVNGVEYVDLEDDIAGKIPRYGKTKRIVSHHSFRNTPDNLRELHARMKSLDADIVKIGTTSITVDVEVYVERNRLQKEVVKVTEARLVYVATDEQRKPRALAPL